MKAIIEQKSNEVNRLVNDLKDATSILVFEYHGVPTKIITSIRKNLHNANAIMYVAKNNIFNRAFKLANINFISEMNGPNAIIISHGDQIVPFKEVNNLIKEYSKVVYKKGIIENSTIIDNNQLSQIASIPNRESLYSMVLSCLQAPIRNFLYGLKAIADTKPQN